jgi:hypothetical protein
MVTPSQERTGPDACFDPSSGSDYIAGRRISSSVARAITGWAVASFRQIEMVKVSYHAKEQMKRLSPHERQELDRLLNESDASTHAPPADASHRFVSRLGDDKRVVWRKTDSGDVVVLTVMSK